MPPQADAGVPPPAASADAGVRGRPWLDGVDLMRLLAVTGVVAVHVVSFTNRTDSAAAGAVTVLLHTSREIFVTLAALVLTYTYGARGRWSLPRFWARRYWLVALPYVAWTAIYLAADGDWSGRSMVGQFGRALLTGSARYHLYFLLVTMQLYLVFPLLLRLIEATRGRHRALLAGSLVLQLAFTAAVHWRVTVPPPLAAWLSHPDALLPSYQLYIVAGALLAVHLEAVGAWARRHLALVAAAVVAVVVGTQVSYLVDVRLLRFPPLRASEVFQPAVTVASLAVLLGLHTAGTLWAGWRERPGWADRLVRGGAYASFGIYLVHPLVIQSALALAAAAGLLTRLATMHARVTLGLDLLVLTPMVLAASWALSAVFGRSLLSLPLTGRPRRRPDLPGRPLPSSMPRLALGGALAAACLGVVLVVAVGTELFPQALTRQTWASARLPDPTRTAVPTPESPPPPPSPPPAPAGTTAAMHTVAVGGLQRSYQVIQPQHPVNARLPALVFLHGIGADIGLEEQRDGLLPLASQGKAVLVYPVGYGESWNAGACCGAAHDHGIDDVAFLSQVVRQVGALSGTDRSRIYVIGFSNGGRMAYDLACHQPRLIAGFAVVGAQPSSGCSPGPPVSLLQIAGTTDPDNPYPQVVAHVNTWMARDGCAGTVTSQRLGTLTTQSWVSCQQGARVELATYAGAGHGPNGSGSTPSMEQVIWAFVTRSRLPG